jgi:hypothetical protein
VIGAPKPPNIYGLIGVGFHVVTLPSSPDGQEIPFATAACILSVN